MNLEEQTLLIVLLAFAAGIALGRLWVRLAERGDDSRRRGTGSFHFIRGLDSLAAGRTAAAVVELTSAARENTEATEIYLILGNLLREKGQLERAIQIHQSILHRPGLSEKERAHTLLCLAMDFKRAGFRERARDTLSEVLELEPDNAHAMNTLVKVYEEEKDWEGALSMVRRAQQAGGDPDPTLLAFLHDQIGQSACSAGEATTAERTFGTAITTARNLAPPYIHLGELLRQQDRQEEARKTWEKLVEVSPHDAYLVFDRLEETYAPPEKNQAMEELFQTIIARDENDWRAHVALASLKSQEGDDDQAFRLLFTASKQNPHSLAVHHAIWEMMLEHGTPDRIAKYLEVVSHSVFFWDPHLCVKCGYRANRILWRCPHCQEWNSFVEERIETNRPGPRE